MAAQNLQEAATEAQTGLEKAQQALKPYSLETRGVRLETNTVPTRGDLLNEIAMRTKVLDARVSELVDLEEGSEPFTTQLKKIEQDNLILLRRMYELAMFTGQSEPDIVFLPGNGAPETVRPTEMRLTPPSADQEYQTGTFKCYGDYKKCCADVGPGGSKASCALLLTACLAKELIPFTGGNG